MTTDDKIKDENYEIKNMKLNMRYGIYKICDK